tara:strand:+ start:3904 stop:4110 length:207 start_codon:yes stop_codon:yes gene_type:complete
LFNIEEIPATPRNNYGCRYILFEEKAHNLGLAKLGLQYEVAVLPSGSAFGVYLFRQKSEDAEGFEVTH